MTTKTMFTVLIMTLVLVTGSISLASTSSTSEKLSNTAWLDQVNSFRAMANLPPVTENATWSQGCELHSRYMVKNDVVAHEEDSSNAWYTTEGNTAAKNGNVAVQASSSADDSVFLNMWITGPFHGISMIDPKLYKVGYGSYRENIGTWKSAGTLDITRGRGGIPADVQFPVMFPADGKKTTITRYTGGEAPDPLSPCSGYSVPSGPPIMVQFASTPSVTAHSFSKDGQVLESCVYDETNYTNSNGSYQSTGRTILKMRHGVVIMPREPLTDGTYNVSLTSNGTNHTWSFCVGDSCTSDTTPTPTATQKATATPTSTPTPSPTPTPPPTPDAYEQDNTCQRASSIQTDGTHQSRSFHEQGDTDWVAMDTVTGTHYLIDVRVPSGSRANVGLDLYQSCDTIYSSPYTNYTDTLGIRLNMRAPAQGPLYLKLYHEDGSVFGGDVNYTLSVRDLPATNSGNALIIVADNDPGQQRINQAAQVVNRHAMQYGGYQDGQIYRLYAPYTGVYNDPLTKTLQLAISEWAKETVGQGGMLTLYITGNAEKGRIFLEKSSGQYVDAALLHTWLSELEAARPDIRINIVLDASYAGSFLSALRASSSTRVIIASTGADHVAWVSRTGTLFTDYFFQSLAQGGSFYTALHDAREAIEKAAPWSSPGAGVQLQAANSQQVPQLDDTGDGIADANDGALAKQRGLIAATSPSNQPAPPFIRQVPQPTIQQGVGTVQALVQHDTDAGALAVWAKIYPPSYRPAESTGEPGSDTSVPTTTLTLKSTFAATQDSWYEGTYTFQDAGTYRVVVYAEDANNLLAQPSEITVTVEQDNPVYLPFIQRN